MCRNARSGSYVVNTATVRSLLQAFSVAVCAWIYITVTEHDVIKGTRYYQTYPKVRNTQSSHIRPTISMCKPNVSMKYPVQLCSYMRLLVHFS